MILELAATSVFAVNYLLKAGIDARETASKYKTEQLKKEYPSLQDEQPKAGDVIYITRRSGWFFGMDHYGVFMEKGTVVHLTEDNSGESSSPITANSARKCNSLWNQLAVVRESPLEDFIGPNSRKEDIHIDRTHDSNALPPDIVCQRARSQVGKKVPYGILGRSPSGLNCESYALSAKTGRNEISSQGTSIGGQVAKFGCLFSGNSQECTRQMKYYQLKAKDPTLVDELD